MNHAPWCTWEHEGSCPAENEPAPDHPVWARLERAEAELERLRPIVRHVAGLTHVDRGNDYASVHRTLIHQAREALQPTTKGDA